MRTCWSFRLCASPCWALWRVRTKCNERLLNIQWQQNNNTKIKRVCDDDSDTDSDNEMLMKNETNWPRFLIVESAKKFPLCSSEGFSSHCRNPEEHQKTEMAPS